MADQTVTLDASQFNSALAAMTAGMASNAAAVDNLTAKFAEYSAVGARVQKSVATITTGIKELVGPSDKVVESSRKIIDAWDGFSAPSRRVKTALNAIKADSESLGNSLKVLTNSVNQLNFNNIVNARAGLREIRADATSTGDAFERFSNKFTLSFANIAKILEVTLLRRVFIELLQGFQQSISAAATFQQKIGEVQTIAAGTGLNFQQLSDRVAGLAAQFNRPGTDVAEGLYQSLSNQVIRTAGDFGFLDEALRLSRITVSSTAAAVNSLSSVINAFQLPISEARRISDQLFRAVDVGRFRLEDLAGSLGRVAVTSSQLGVKFEEMLAFLTLVTRQGVTAHEAMTQLNGIIGALVRPSEILGKTLENLFGTASGTVAISRFGFAEVLRRIAEEARNGNVELAQLFANRRGLQGFLGAAGRGLFEEEVARFSEAGLGAAADRALEAILATTGEKFKTELNKIQLFMQTEFGPKLLEALLKIGEPFGGLANLAKQFADALGGILGIGLGVAGVVTKIAGVFNTFGLSVNTVVIGTIAYVGITRIIIPLLGQLELAMGLGGAAGLRFATALTTLKAAFATLIPVALIIGLGLLIDKLVNVKDRTQELAESFKAFQESQRRAQAELDRQNSQSRAQNAAAITEAQAQLNRLFAATIEPLNQLRDAQRDAVRNTTAALSASSAVIIDEMAQIISRLGRTINEAERNIRDSFIRISRFQDDLNTTLFESQLRFIDQQVRSLERFSAISRRASAQEAAASDRAAARLAASDATRAARIQDAQERAEARRLNALDRAAGNEQAIAARNLALRLASIDREADARNINSQRILSNQLAAIDREYNNRIAAENRFSSSRLANLFNSELIQRRINALLIQAGELSARNTTDAINQARRNFDELRRLVGQRLSPDRPPRENLGGGISTFRGSREDFIPFGPFGPQRLSPLEEGLDEINRLQTQMERAFQNAQIEVQANAAALRELELQRQRMIQATQRALIDFSLTDPQGRLLDRFRGPQGVAAANSAFDALIAAARSAVQPIQLTGEELARLQNRVGQIQAGITQRALAAGTITQEQLIQLGRTVTLERLAELQRELAAHTFNQEAILELERTVGVQRNALAAQLIRERLAAEAEAARQAAADRLRLALEAIDTQEAAVRAATARRDAVLGTLGTNIPQLGPRALAVDAIAAADRRSPRGLLVARDALLATQEAAAAALQAVQGDPQDPQRLNRLTGALHQLADAYERYNTLRLGTDLRPAVESPVVAGNIATLRENIDVLTGADTGLNNANIALQVARRELEVVRTVFQGLPADVNALGVALRQNLNVPLGETATALRAIVAEFARITEALRNLQPVAPAPPPRLLPLLQGGGAALGNNEEVFIDAVDTAKGKLDEIKDDTESAKTSFAGIGKIITDNVIPPLQGVINPIRQIQFGFQGIGREATLAGINVDNGLNASLGRTAGFMERINIELDGWSRERNLVIPSGGGVQERFATGGLIGNRFNTRGPDDRMAWVRTGEFIMNPEATQKFFPTLVAMNKGAFSTGGGYASGGVVNNNSTGDITINVSGAGHDPDQIARAVWGRLKRETRRGNL